MILKMWRLFFLKACRPYFKICQMNLFDKKKLRFGD